MLRKLLSVSVVLAGIVGFANISAATTPPTPTSHFYGDADGDVIISGLDLIQHKNLVGGKPYTYNTLQLPGASTDWNTCDADSDRACSGLDLIVLKNAIAGMPNTVFDDNWTISNATVGGLPATVAPSSSTPFRINVSSFTSTSGRPGITVVAQIMSGGGTLGGRECVPDMGGERDQLALPGATCALAVTQTDWTISTTDGLTETGATGFAFNAPASGATEILFTVNGNPALDMPEVSIKLIVDVVIPNTWAWINGSNSVNQLGVYGSQGIPASTNVPGARGGAVSWTDQQGNLWIFGGMIYSTPWISTTNDLWKWDGINWTWISGSNSSGQLGNYGTKGLASPTNMPGARYGAVPWTDSLGNFWLFGGFGAAKIDTGYLNDLWKWDGTNWTWVSGSDEISQVSVYGTKGIPDSTNIPGARSGAISWTETDNLYLFGGIDGTSGLCCLNDLWKWDGTYWTWISGSNVPNQFGIYGTKGVPASLNAPGARSNSVSWKDSLGNLWLFGGFGYASSSADYLNDLWKWDGTNWAWISGSNDINQESIYGEKGVADSTNIPGARHGSIAWYDSSANLWLFGGQGYASTSTQGYLCDLWKWDGINWTWVSGDNNINHSGVYGVQGVPSSGNFPGGRFMTAGWIDLSGNFWLLGGERYSETMSFSFLNDLWKYTP